MWDSSKLSLLWPKAKLIIPFSIGGRQAGDLTRERLGIFKPHRRPLPLCPACLSPSNLQSHCSTPSENHPVEHWVSLGAVGAGDASSILTDKKSTCLPGGSIDITLFHHNILGSDTAISPTSNTRSQSM